MNASSFLEQWRTLAPCLAMLLLLACSSGAAVTEESHADAAADSAAPPDTAAERDSDGDGLVDPVDACPSEAEDGDGFEDQDGCPDPDNDGDGVADEKDRCPGQGENWNAYLDEDGCPDLNLINARLLLPAVEFPADAVVAEPLPVQLDMLDAVIEEALRNDPDVRFLALGGHGHRDSLDGLRCARARYLIDILHSRGYDSHLFVPSEGPFGDAYATVAPVSDRLVRESTQCEPPDGE